MGWKKNMDKNMDKHHNKHGNMFHIVQYTLFLFRSIENKVGHSDIRISVQAIFGYPNKFKNTGQYILKFFLIIILIVFVLLLHNVDGNMILLSLA